MFRRKKSDAHFSEPGQDGTVNCLQAHQKNSAAYPTGILNGYLTSAPNRRNPSTDKDHSPREFRRSVNASGAQDVQIYNGLQRRIGSGYRPSLQFVNWLYAAQPTIPGQMRPDRGGNHKRGIDPLSYNALWQNGPGSQPSNPGGPGQMASATFYNPGTS